MENIFTRMGEVEFESKKVLVEQAKEQGVEEVAKSIVNAAKTMVRALTILQETDEYDEMSDDEQEVIDLMLDYYELLLGDEEA